MKLLVTGGAGYIGSHITRQAQLQNHDVCVLDDFSTGNEWAVKDCETLRVSLLDKDSLKRCVRGRDFDGVIHLAAKSLVGESITNPYTYYEHNVVGSLNLLNEMLKNDVDRLVFSSTAAIFGNPATDTIRENHPKNPINPYGQTKLVVEQLLKDISITQKLSAVCLRYFNAAGADPDGQIGEAHDPETHLIPLLLKSHYGENHPFRVFGNNYPTADGTCIRDYVHVNDLADAHLLALEKLQNTSGFFDYNLGNSIQSSVMEVIKCCERTTGRRINYKIGKHRKGDAAVLVANSEKAKTELGWRPKFDNLEKIIETAWNWQSQFESY